ncbi:unnamed protein product [Cladocopium goreaui]|uniref:Uncharacterized protein n=1 Tax=Cladocopium goreaui TaxID=2562237 RepID=A0A9P1FDR8_9DINO|nr:unnamed protein product [Cladocopium goreaui]|mmetsp:Transcript_62824/g.137632  ORF Transcript_62824/g.137632 Transcript_62824/m.137632 type:complete len:115 (+) Transcript_62824:75-419(+)
MCLQDQEEALGRDRRPKAFSTLAVVEEGPKAHVLWELFLSAKKVCLHLFRSLRQNLHLLMEKEVKTLMLPPRQLKGGKSVKPSFKPLSSFAHRDGGPLRRVPKSWTLAVMAGSD